MEACGGGVVVCERNRKMREEERLTRLASCRDALDTLDFKSAAEDFTAMKIKKFKYKENVT